MIDYKEIKSPTDKSAQQDTFELFARDFLEEIGYRIIQHPDRGPDGKKDMIVGESFKGIEEEIQRKWLVSCKHFAHSGKSVLYKDEPEIIERLKIHKCDGFIGVYSTLPSSAMNDKLKGLDIDYRIYDCSRIEAHLLKSKQRERLIMQYFPNSFMKYKSLVALDKSDQMPDRTNLIAFTREDLIEITKTSIILLDINKIREEYFGSSWEDKKIIIKKLFSYTEHISQEIIDQILQFLYDAANETRGGMPEDIAINIQFLILSYFSSTRSIGNPERNLDQALFIAQIGFDITYDAILYLRNLRVAAHGLSILKYMYRYGKENKVDKIQGMVEKLYKDLEQTSRNWEGDNADIPKRFLSAFKKDLATSDLSFPPLPDDIMQIFDQKIISPKV